MKKDYFQNLTVVLMALIISIGSVSCDNLKPEEVVDKTVSALQTEDYKEIANYLYVDTLQTLNSEETEIFVNALTELRTDKPQINSFEIMSFPNENSNNGDFKVKLIFSDGVKEIQCGRLVKDQQNKWKLDILSDSVQTIENETLFGQDIKIALLKVLASRSIAQRQYELGLCYLESPILKSDTVQAVRLIKAASDAEYAPALGKYGGFMLHGENGVPKNATKAFQLAEKGAEMGDSYSMYLVSDCYADGEGVEQDYNKAFEYASKGAELGNPDAICILGWCYDNGKGTKVDNTAAFECFERAAKFDNTRAIRNLGVLYEAGRGVKKDYRKAVDFYKIAAERGDTYACYRLGWCYWEGNGVEKNKNEAYKWVKKAADDGMPLAISLMKWIEKH